MEVTLDGATIGGASSRSVSFPYPEVDCVQGPANACKGAGGDPASSFLASTTEATEVTIRGRNFGSHPALTSSREGGRPLRAEIVAGQPAISVCENSSWVSSVRMRCTLVPSRGSPLSLRLLGHRGEILGGPIELRYEPPEVTSVSPRVLPLSGRVTLVVEGRGLPAFGEPVAYLVRPAAGTARRLDLQEEQEPQEAWLCSLERVERQGTSRLECFVEPGNATASLGCAQPEFKVSFGGLESRPFPGLRTRLPSIARVDSDEGEVGASLEYRIYGESFAGADPLRVRVGDRSCSLVSRTRRKTSTRRMKEGKARSGPR